MTLGIVMPHELDQAEPTPSKWPTAIVDTREQLPLELAPLPVVRACLPAGDYSIEGMEERVAIERKTMGDLVSTLTYGRERFERELDRLATYERALILVEGDLSEIVEARYRSQVPPQCLVGSFASFFARWGIATVFAGNRRNAQIMARAFLTKCSKHLGGRA
jgi:DNA excision repair protein ERCC-4